MELQEFTKPLTASEIEFKIQSSKNGKTLVVPYIDNRCVMARFDAQFGWDGWENKFEAVDGGFLCTITVKTADGRSVSKQDAASRTGIEPVKGGCSDAMKRCAVQFGLGRDLYDYPKIYLAVETKFIPGWATKELNRLVELSLSGQLNRDVYVLEEGKSTPAPVKPAPTAAKPAAEQPTNFDKWKTEIEGLAKTLDAWNAHLKELRALKGGMLEFNHLKLKALTAGFLYDTEKKVFVTMDSIK